MKKNEAKNLAKDIFLDECNFKNTVYMDDFKFSNKNAVDVLDKSYYAVHKFWHKRPFYNFYADEYDRFCVDVEKFLIFYSPSYTLKYHNKKFKNKFMFEILSNLYAVEKTKQYIKNNPGKYDYNTQKLDLLEKKYLILYKNYNLSKRLDIILRNYKDISKIKDLDTEVFNIFMNQDGTPKDLNKIIKNPKISEVDTTVLFAFLNTKTFMKSVNFFKLNKEAEKILMLANNRLPQHKEYKSKIKEH